MDAPKCKFCGVSEWRHVCGQIVDRGYSGGRVVVGSQGRHKARKDERERDQPQSLPDAPATAFDRKAYQRAYMRGYRKRQALMLETAKAIWEGRAEFMKKG